VQQHPHNDAWLPLPNTGHTRAYQFYNMLKATVSADTASQKHQHASAYFGLKMGLNTSLDQHLEAFATARALYESSFTDNQHLGDVSTGELPSFLLLLDISKDGTFQCPLETTRTTHWPLP
jgi:hypothetical protein